MINSEGDYIKEYRFVIDELDADDSKRLLGIMAEFIDGFSMLSRLEPMVSIFGSAQPSLTDGNFELAERLGGKLANEGIGVITGGGPGVMEAANKGTFEAGGSSIGVAIDLPQEQKTNQYMTHHMKLRHFFVRKVMLIKYSLAFVIFPGGYGTLDELFEALTLIRTKRILPFPVIMFGSRYWRPMLDWLSGTVLAEGYIKQDDFDTIHLTDDLDEVVRICKDSISKSVKYEWIKKSAKK